MWGGGGGHCYQDLENIKGLSFENIFQPDGLQFGLKIKVVA